MQVTSVEDNPVFNVMGAKNIPVVTADEVNTVKNTYFQAVLLHGRGWCPISLEGSKQYIQLRKCNLVKFPPLCRLVIDLLVREDEEEELKYYTDNFLGAEIREGQFIFFANTSIPIHLVLGMKLVSTVDNQTIIIPPDEDIRVEKSQY